MYFHGLRGHFTHGCAQLLTSLVVRMGCGHGDLHVMYIAKRNIFQGEPLEAVLSDYNIWNLKNGIILHAVLELSFQFH